MRFHRYISAFIALIAATVMTVGLTTTAAHADKAKRPLSYSAGEIRNSGKFQVHGKVGHYKKRIVTLQQKKRGGDWHKINKDRTSKNGGFAMKFDGPGGSKYRLVIPGDSSYKKKIQYVGRIYRA